MKKADERPRKGMKPRPFLPQAGPTVHGQKYELFFLFGINLAVEHAEDR